MSFKNGLGVCTISYSIDHALMINFAPQNAPKIGPRSLPIWFQRALEGALGEDSFLKPKKEVVESTEEATSRLKLGGFRVSRGRETGRGQTALSSHARQPCTRQGSADLGNQARLDECGE